MIFYDTVNSKIFPFWTYPPRILKVLPHFHYSTHPSIYQYIYLVSTNLLVSSVLYVGISTRVHLWTSWLYSRPQGTMSKTHISLLWGSSSLILPRKGACREEGSTSNCVRNLCNCYSKLSFPPVRSRSHGVKSPLTVIILNAGSYLVNTKECLVPCRNRKWCAQLWKSRRAQ